MSVLHALLITALAPVLENVVALARHRRVDLFGVLVFLSLLLSGVVVLFGGSPRMILARESVLSGAFGLALLASLLCREPLIYYLTRHFVAGQHPARREEYHRKAAAPRFRSFMRLLTVVWGVVTVADAALNVYLAFNVSIAHFLAVSPLARSGMFGCTFLWTLLHAQRGRYLAYMFGA
jgi:intracellular septation protein A